jgi:hypothetical protein
MGPRNEHYKTFSINRPDQQSMSLGQKSNLSNTIATLKEFNKFLFKYSKHFCMRVFLKKF